MSIRGIFLWLLFLSFFFPLSAQLCEHTLLGVVVQQNDRSPLPYASIHLKELGRTVLSDANGHFQFGELCPGTYTFVCHHSSCEELEHTHEVSMEDSLWTLEVERKEFSLGEVSISTEREAVQPSQAVSRLTGTALHESQGQDLGTALKDLPGISQLQTGATISKPIIHGLHSNRVLILNNGIRQEGQQWGSEHAPEIDPFVATQLSVIKGSAAVRYGSGAMAGVILVEPAPLRDSAGIGGQFHLKGYSNGRQGVASAQLEGNSGQYPAWSWRIQGTLRRGGNLHTPDYFLENTGLAEQNFSATIGFRTPKKGSQWYYSRFQNQLGILSPAHIGSENDLLRAINSPQPLGSDTVSFSYAIARPYQTVTHQLAKWNGYYRTANGSKWTATYAFQQNRRREFDKHRPRGTNEEGQDIAELDFRIQTHTLEGVWQHPVKQGFRGEMGAFGLYQGNLLEGRPFIPNYILLGGEAFLIEHWRRNRWEVEAGFRYDYRWINSAREEAGRDIFTVREFQNVSGSVGATLDVAPGWELKGQLGNVWRPPHVNELFSDGLHHGAAAVEIGDSTLNPERGWKGIMSLTYQLPSGWSGELSLYQQQFQNFIYQQPDGIERTIRGSFPRLSYTETPVRLRGVDLSLAYQAAVGFQWSAKGAWLDSRNLRDRQPLIYMPANWLESSLGWEVSRGKRGQGTFFHVSARHTTEQKQVPTSDNPESADWLPPPSAYTLLGVRAGTAFSWQQIRWEVGIQTDNLLNVNYRDYLDRFRYYADAPGRNISLRLSGTF